MPTFDKSLDFALDLLRAHPTWCLFPIKRYQKHPPLFGDNLNLASNDPKQVAKWHAKWPGCNWGISVKKSGLIVVDVDRKLGKVGEATFYDLELKHGDANTDAFPATLKIQSPTGGWHLYYNATAKVPHIHALGKHGFGPDIDSTNYVLAPGCWIFEKDKKTGASITGGYDALTDHEVVDAPEWFGQYLREKAKPQGGSIPETELDQPGNVAWAIHYLENDAPPCIEGQNGEKTLFDVAGVLKDHGISQWKAVELLSEHYNVFGKCDPLWSVGEGPVQDRLDVKVENAYRYLSENAPGADTPQAHFSGETDTDEELADLKKGFEQRDSERKAKGDAKDAKAEKTKAENKKKDSKTQSNVDKVLDEWVYVKNQKRFVKIDDQDFRNYVWDVEAYDLAFCEYKGSFNKFHERVLEGRKGSRMIRKFDMAKYIPGEDKFHGNIYNTWRPSRIIPKEGDTSLWDTHMAFLFPDESERNLVLNWIAWMLQHLAEKPTHALLLTGYQQGTGKSWVTEVVKEILGPHNVSPVGEDELESPFNEWAQKSKLLIVEELQALDRGAVKKKLHPLITQTSTLINDKNVKRFKAENCFAIMAMSNEDAAISINQNDRRYLIVRTHSVPQEIGYYEKLYAALKDEALLGAIYHKLLMRELGSYSGKGRAPSTKAKTDMIEAGLTDLEHWCVNNAESYPLNAHVICADDIEAILPPRIAKLPKFTQNITSILRHRFGGHPLGQCRLPGSRHRPSLWGINKYSGIHIKEAFHGKVYLDEKAAADKISASHAGRDFGDADADEQE